MNTKKHENSPTPLEANKTNPLMQFTQQGTNLAAQIPIHLTEGDIVRASLEKWKREGLRI